MTEKDLLLDLKKGLIEKVNKINKTERIFIDMVNIPKEIKQEFMKFYGKKYANNIVEPILKELQLEGLFSKYKLTVNKKNENCLTITIKK